MAFFSSSLIIMLMGIFAGIARHLSNLNNDGKKPGLGEFFIDVFLAVFVATIVNLFCKYLKFDENLSLAIVGILSHQGTRAFHLIGNYLSNKSSITISFGKDDDK